MYIVIDLLIFSARSAYGVSLSFLPSVLPESFPIRCCREMQTEVHRGELCTNSRPRMAEFLQIFCQTTKNGRRVFSCHPLGSDNTANSEFSGALLSPVRPWVAVPNSTVLQTSPAAYRQGKVEQAELKTGAILPMVRIPLEASFYPPLGSVEYKKALLLIMNELCSHSSF